jgi:hypothetical protein
MCVYWADLVQDTVDKQNPVNNEHMGSTNSGKYFDCLI